MDTELSAQPPPFAAPNGDELSRGFTIELVECYGEWFVRTVRKDRTIALSRFDSERFAFSHAETERLRLGIGSVCKV